MTWLINEHRIKEDFFFHIARSFNQFFLKLNIHLSTNTHYKKQVRERKARPYKEGTMGKCNAKLAKLRILCVLLKIPGKD